MFENNLQYSTRKYLYILTLKHVFIKQRISYVHVSFMFFLTGMNYIFHIFIPVINIFNAVRKTKQNQF